MTWFKAWFNNIAPCLGLPVSPKISVLQHFFVAGMKLSLVNQMKILKSSSFIKLHLKIVDTGSTMNAINSRIDDLRLIYGNYGIGVVVRSTEKLLNMPPEFIDIDVDGCTSGDPSDSQEDLYNNNTNYVIYESDPNFGFIFTREIVLFFVRNIINPSGPTGCASSSPFIPCAVIKRNNSLTKNYILAHEIGHLLGLHGHPDDDGDSDPQQCIPDRLMTDCPISSNPYLVDSEVQDMKSSPLMFQC
jgi:hypothetical protein